MKINELIQEGVHRPYDTYGDELSLDTAIQNVYAYAGNSVELTYHKLKEAADAFYHNKGTIDGFGMVAGGVGGRWTAEYWFKLRSALVVICRKFPREATSMKEFLRSNPKSFSEIFAQLPDELINLGELINQQSLVNYGKAINQARNSYQEFIEKLKNKSSDPTKKDQMKSQIIGTAPEVDNNLGQQNSQAEKLVNDILNSLPGNVSSQIRPKIARAGNKIFALKAELQKLGYQV